jgi:cell division protein FtsB
VWLKGNFLSQKMAKPMRLAHTIWVPMLLAWGIAVIGLAMFRGESSFDGYLALVKSRDLLRGTVGQIAQENSAIQSEILKLKESPSYARKVLRDKYHVVEQDENIVFFAE